MWIVQIALRRPYTFVVFALLIAIFGGLAARRTPTDILPNINIPVVSVVWTYNGLLPNDMSSRVIYFYERYLTAQVGDIEHLESQSLSGYGVVKIFFQKNVNISMAVAQVTAASQTVLKLLPPGHHAALCAELQRLERADPAARAVEQEAAADAAVRSRPELHPSAARDGGRRRRPLALWRQSPPGPGRSRSAGDAGPQRLRRRRRQHHHGAEPDPAGRRREARQIRLERRAQRQPRGAGEDQRPAGEEGQRHDHLHARCRLCASGLAAADEPRSRQRLAGGADDHPQGRRRLDAQRHRRGQVAAAAGRGEPAGEPQPARRRRPVDLRQGRGGRRHPRGGACRPPRRRDDPHLSRQLALDGHHPDRDSARHPVLVDRAVVARRDHQCDDARRARSCRRHPGR